MQEGNALAVFVFCRFVDLARLRRVRAPRATLLHTKRRAASGQGVQAAPGDEHLEYTQNENIAGRRRGHRRLDRAQRRDERRQIPRCVQRRGALAEGLGVRIGTEPLHELPVRHAAGLEPLARLLVVLGRGFDEERATLASADAAAERLFRRGGCVAFPEERFDDHGSAACRAGRAVELAHRNAVRRPDERALSHSIERREDFVAGRRERDRAARPFAQRVARFRNATPIGALGGVRRRPRMRERIEDDAAARRVRVRVEVGERRGKCGAETVERTGK